MRFDELSRLDTDAVYQQVQRLTEIGALQRLLDEADDALNYYAVVCLRVRIRNLRRARRRRRRKRLGTSA